MGNSTISSTPKSSTSISPHTVIPMLPDKPLSSPPSHTTADLTTTKATPVQAMRRAMFKKDGSVNVAKGQVVAIAGQIDNRVKGASQGAANHAIGGMKGIGDTQIVKDLTCIDLVIMWKNLCLLFMKPRRYMNFRWANSMREHVVAGQHFAKGQFYKVYGRISKKYNYHTLQHHLNLMRRFNPSEPLVDYMKAEGTKMFYNIVCGRSTESPAPSFEPDLTLLSSLSSVTTSADYLFHEVRRVTSEATALMARESYVRGFSRPIQVDNLEDWEKFRQELNESIHLGALSNDISDDDTLPIAVSYKAKEVKITRRMYILNEDNAREDDGILAQENLPITQDFVTDHRWSQLVRCCIEIARMEEKKMVRLWIDRLVMLELPPEERVRRYELVQWWDFGLFAYAVCPVVRLYEKKEIVFGSDFWRKLETVMGVAGRGLYVDDYLLRLYDHTIFYGRSSYKRIGRGFACIGGQGTFVRNVTLALATALMTDGLTVAGENEDVRTKKSIVGWKAWALRTMGEGAYSMSHSAMLREEPAFEMGMEQFRTVAFWESFVSTCGWLEGESYLDMSMQLSTQWRKGGHWDGVVEWVGMVRGAVNIVDHKQIIAFLTDNVKSSTWTATTGHTATLLSLKDDDERGQRTDKIRPLKRTLTVELARHSPLQNGHVTAVAESTGLWGEKVLPWWLRHEVDPNVTQKAQVHREKGLEIFYTDMPVVMLCSREFWLGFLFCLVMLCLGTVNPLFFLISFLLLLIVVVKIFRKYFSSICCAPWPWRDHSGIGEALFDNLLKHGLYDAGIKVQQYRENMEVPYDQLGWR